MKKLAVDTAAIFVLTFLITFFVEGFIKKLWIYKIAFPDQYGLEDFEFEDFSFSNRKTYGFKDKNITLINIGELSRVGIAEQIRILDEYKPKVIGINVFFNCDAGLRDTINCPQLKDVAGNLMFHEAIKNSGNIVLTSKLMQSKAKVKYLDSLDKSGSNYEDEYDSLELSDPEFASFSSNGFANLPTNAADQNDVKLCRSFISKVMVKDAYQYAFAIEVCRKFDEKNTATFLKIAADEMLINYRGNITIKNDLDTTYRHLDYFKTLDASDIMKRNFNPDDIRNKIVLMGYLGDYLSDKRMDAMFYSPLNIKPLGKSLPDMYGLVVHANIISMIVNQDLIEKLSTQKSMVISILIVILNIWFFIRLEQKETVWKEVFIIAVPAFQIILLSLLRYASFSLFNYIFELSLASVLLVSVSLSTTLYFGPIRHSMNWIKLKISK